MEDLQIGLCSRLDSGGDCKVHSNVTVSLPAIGSRGEVLRVLSESYYRLDLVESVARILILRRRLDSLENGERHIPIGPGPGFGPEIPRLAINARRARVWSGLPRTFFWLWV